MRLSRIALSIGIGIVAQGCNRYFTRPTASPVQSCRAPVDIASWDTMGLNSPGEAARPEFRMPDSLPWSTFAGSYSLLLVPVLGSRDSSTMRGGFALDQDLTGRMIGPWRVRASGRAFLDRNSAGPLSILSDDPDSIRITVGEYATRKVWMSIDGSTDELGTLSFYITQLGAEFIIGRWIDGGQIRVSPDSPPAQGYFCATRDASIDR